MTMHEMTEDVKKELSETPLRTSAVEDTAELIASANSDDNEEFELEFSEEDFDFLVDSSLDDLESDLDDELLVDDDEFSDIDFNEDLDFDADDEFDEDDNSFED